MICTQASVPVASGRILIASDLADGQEAADEVSHWLHVHGYRQVPWARPLLAYENGVCVREWLHAEPQPHARSSVHAPGFFRFLFASRVSHH